MSELGQKRRFDWAGALPVCPNQQTIYEVNQTSLLGQKPPFDANAMDRLQLSGDRFARRRQHAERLAAVVSGRVAR